MRLMLDTMIYDEIVETPGILELLPRLVDEGEMEILVPHIQEDELANDPDERKRAEVAKIPRQEIPTRGAVWDTSKWDKATWGDGSEGGVGVNEIRSERGGHTHDALIATSAAGNADVLVTEDNRLKNRLKDSNSICEVWTFERFRSFAIGESTTTAASRPSGDSLL